VVEITRRYPEPELWELEKQGKVILGVFDHQPGFDLTWECTKLSKDLA